MFVKNLPFLHIYLPECNIPDIGLVQSSGEKGKACSLHGSEDKCIHRFVRDQSDFLDVGEHRV